MKWENIPNKPRENWVPAFLEGFKRDGDDSVYVRVGLSATVGRVLEEAADTIGFLALRDDGFVVWLNECPRNFQPQRARFTSD